MFCKLVYSYLYFHLLKPLQRNNRSIKSLFTINYNIVTEPIP